MNTRALQESVFCCLCKEETISTRLRLGDLLVQANLVTREDVVRAMERQALNGGRLGEILAEMGVIKQEVLDGFLKRIPTEPLSIAATGIDELDLMGLMMRLIYIGRLESARQFVDAIKLPYQIVADLIKMAIDRRLMHSLGMGHAQSPIDMRYAMTDEGRRWTVDAMEQSRYAGPAPVTLEAFNYQVNLQKPTNEWISLERIRKSLGEFVFDDSTLEKCGPGLNSGRAMLLYGPPGNGKSSIAFCLSSVFSDVIYVPYAITVEGQIIRFFDPSIHAVVNPGDWGRDESSSFVRTEQYDTRWVACKRPFVVTGGELTLEMLDLLYNSTAHFYEAPLHMKALGGCFLIDDFGRQLVSPANLLNRWIVPLQNRVDYLKLHTGKSFSIPFEELVMFSTNLDPEDLMDPAFLRRLPYKIEIGTPTVENYRRIFDKECERQGLTMTDEIFNTILYKLKNEKEMMLAAYQPRFIVDQVVATCRFLGLDPHLEPRFIDYALDNLRVRRSKREPNITSATVK
jgi:hypothetical protein